MQTGSIKLFQSLYEQNLEEILEEANSIMRLSVNSKFIFGAISRNNLELLIYILRIKPELINSVNKYGSSVLHYAYTYIAQRNPDITHFLIENGAGLSLKNARDKTAADVIRDPVQKAKYKKLEQAYIQVKPIINKLLAKQDLSSEEKILLNQSFFIKEEDLSEDMQNIKSTILNIIGFEIRKHLCQDNSSEALNVIDSLTQEIHLAEFASYKAMIHQYNQIKEWEVEKNLSPKHYLPSDMFKIIEEFLESRDIKFFLSELPKISTADYREALLKLDFETVGEIYEKLKIIHDKVITKIFEISDAKIILPQEVKGYQHDNENDEVEGGAEESKGGETSAHPKNDEAGELNPVNHLLMPMDDTIEMPAQTPDGNAASEEQTESVGVAGTSARSGSSDIL